MEFKTTNQIFATLNTSLKNLVVLSLSCEKDKDIRVKYDLLTDLSYS